LTLALDLERYGANVLDLAPGLLHGARLALNAYHALDGYKSSAPNATKWIANHQKAYEFVTLVLAARRAAAEERDGYEHRD